MNKLTNPIALLLVVQGLSALSGGEHCQAAVIVDHTCRNIRQIPTNWIAQAKQKLHIAYGHTSHGEQVSNGMRALASFMNTNGYPVDFFAWNYGGSGGALDLRDDPGWTPIPIFQGAFDLGNPNFTVWAEATRNYLSNAPDCNVVMWSWCGEVSDSTETDINTYLSLMDGLQRHYTNVTFIHMTGHLDGSGANRNLNLRNNQIRSHCLANGEVLYDFADIESYDPDGLTNYMILRADDDCLYDSDGNGSRDRNWALDWQNTHTEGVDWFSCDAPHSQPLNGNLKAYAAWWLWARLAGWQGLPYSFDQWQRDQFTAEELSNPALENSLWGRWADPDADRLPNIFEYALGQPPRDSTGAGVSLQMMAGNAASSPLLIYYRAFNTEGVSFDLEYSKNLLSWVSMSPTSVSNRVESVGNGLERVEVQVLESPARHGCFYRLRLTAD